MLGLMAIKLLLADDSPTIAKILSMALAQEDYAVTSVANAADADKEILQNPQPALFLVDIALPEKDGFTFARELKSKAETSGIRIIFLASSFDPVDNDACIAAGADGIIKKPFDPAELRRILKEVLAKEPTSFAPKSAPSKDVLDDKKVPAESIESTPAVATPSESILESLIPEEDGLELPASPPEPIADAGPATKQDAIPDSTEINELGLSANAKELLNFFNAEVETSKTKTGLKAPPTETSAEPVLEANAETKASAEKGEDLVDLSSALEDWAPVNLQTPSTDALSQWQSKTQKADPMFDIADASFRFSADYVSRISRAFDHNDEVKRDLDYQNPGNISEILASPSPNLEITPSAPSLSKNPKPNLAPHAEIMGNTANFNNSQKTTLSNPPISKAEMEEIIRDEVRLVCKSIVEKIAWDTIPELAENIIRTELDKVLKDLEK